MLLSLKSRVCWVWHTKQASNHQVTMRLASISLGPQTSPVVSWPFGDSLFVMYVGAFSARMHGLL